MLNNNEIKQFVKETLGCTCPDEVFNHIDCQAEIAASGGEFLDYEINIGNKLLVFVVTIDEHASLELLISQLVWDGIRKRNQDGFNRFRLVLLTQRPTDVADEAFSFFQYLGADERVHLHVVGTDGFPLVDVYSKK
jgi:hypothetical protein